MNFTNNDSFIAENEAGPSEEEGGEGDEGDEEEEEDVSSLQIAWEVLELSRIIYSRQESPEAQRKLAKVKIKLGEVRYFISSDFCSQVMLHLMRKLEGFGLPQV